MNQAHGLFSINAQVLELDRVFVERVEQILGLVGAELSSLDENIESLVGIFRHSRFEHGPNGFGDRADFLAENVGDLLRAAADLLQLLGGRVGRDESLLPQVLQRLVGGLDGLGVATGVELACSLAELGGLLGARAELRGEQARALLLADGLGQPSHEGGADRAADQGALDGAERAGDAGAGALGAALGLLGESVAELASGRLAGPARFVLDDLRGTADALLGATQPGLGRGVVDRDGGEQLADGERQLGSPPRRPTPRRGAR